MDDLDRRMRRLAARQHAQVTRRQLVELGFSRAMIRARTARGELEPVGPHVLRLVGSTPSPRQDTMAAVLSCGPTARASHRTAANLLGLDGCSRRSGRPEVSVVRPARGDRRLTVVHEVRRRGPGDDARVDDIPVTSVARTLVDLAGTLSRSSLETVVDAALRDGRTSVDHLRRHLRRLGGHGVAGAAALRALLDEGAARPESWLERRALELFREAGFPAPEVQRVVAGRDGALARVDLAFAGGRIVVELAGHRTHSTRRQRQHDHERANRLALVGITVLQFTYEDVRERPEHVVAIVGEALRAAA